MKPPAHLGTIERKLWSDLALNYGIEDAAGIALLTAACEAAVRCRQARELLDAEGLIGANGRVHPAVAIQRDFARVFGSCIDRLGLDIVPPLPHGRPPGLAVKRVK